jgi:hypothetical protein
MRRADAKNARIRLAPRRIRLARIVGHSLEKYAETLNDVLLSTNIADQRRLRPHAQGRRPVTQVKIRPNLEQVATTSTTLASRFQELGWRNDYMASPANESAQLCASRHALRGGVGAGACRPCLKRRQRRGARAPARSAGRV